MLVAVRGMDFPMRFMPCGIQQCDAVRLKHA